ncbi:hypothetical protein BCD48_28035 [Pseudofrankia sp. BMG5.36]|nr:hypothetical protein BCD48_28035 [Pseudofrankia sp. BMG5.36]
MASICCSPPDRAPAACLRRWPRSGNQFVGDRLHGGAGGSRMRRDEEVLGAGEVREDAASLGETAQPPWASLSVGGR